MEWVYVGNFHVHAVIDINNIRVFVLGNRVHFPNDAERQEYWEALAPGSIGMILGPLI